MTIAKLISSLSEDAIICSLTSKNLLVFNNNELKMFAGFTKCGDSVYFSKEVNLQLSNDIPQKIKKIVVSKKSTFVILISQKSNFIIRIHPDIISASIGALKNEYICECYPLDENLLLQNHSCQVIETKILTHNVLKMTIAAVLYSDNSLRFYNIYKKKSALLLTLDFRLLVHDSLDTLKSNNTFGLYKSIVSFDFKPSNEEETSFAVIAVDSESNFYSSTIFHKCFTEGITPKIDKIDLIFNNPCDPLVLQFIETSIEEIASVFVLISSGCKLTHLIAIPNEFGSFELVVYEQLKIESIIGEPKILQSHHLGNYSKNRYEVITASSLFSVNISPLIEEIINNETTSSGNSDSMVHELVSVVNELNGITKLKSIKAVSLELSKLDNCENEFDDELFEIKQEIMHLVIFGSNIDEESMHFLMGVTTFEPSNDSKTIKNESFLKETTQLKNRENYEIIEQISAQMKPLSACLIGDDLSEEEAINTAFIFLKNVQEKLETHKILAKALLDKCADIQVNASSVGEKSQNVDERLIEETKNVEELKLRMFELKSRMEIMRKSINVLVSRIEDNVPLSEIEIRMFVRLKEQQNLLSQMAINIPKMELDLNEQKRISQNLRLKTLSKPANKFSKIEKNEKEINSLEKTIEQLKTEISKFDNSSA